MHKTTAAIESYEIYRRLLVGLREESQRNPNLGAPPLLSNSSDALLCSVQDLDKQIEFAEQSLIGLISYVTAAKKQRNAILPISKLPTEILGAILEMTRNFDPGHECSPVQRPNHVKHLLTLAAVSSQFFSVVMNTAILWAVADWRCSASQVKRCLEKSGGASMSVEYDSRGLYRFNEIMAPTWWVDSLVSDHIARWRDAYLVLDSEEDLETLSKLAAPQLRRIAIHYTDETLGKAIQLFGGNTPNLEIIDLGGIHVNWKWDPNIITNLRSLVLCDVLISKASVGSFLSVIQSSMLEKLAIGYLQLDGTADLTPVSPSWLYRLKDIQITEVHSDVFRYFFGTIRAPHIQNAVVNFPDHRHLCTEAWGQLLLHCLSSIPQHVEQALHIELSFHHQRAQISLFPDVGPPLLLDLGGQTTRLSDPDAIDWVLKNILGYRKRSTLSVRFTSHPDLYIWKILPSLLRLTDVTGVELELSVIEGWTPDPSFLSRPVPKASTEEWLWPKLTNVTLRGLGWEGVGDYILLIVEGRLEASSSPCDRGATCEYEEQSRPSPIQSIRIRHGSRLSQSEVKQLENLVPNIELLSPGHCLVAPVPASEPRIGMSFWP